MTRKDYVKVSVMMAALRPTVPDTTIGEIRLWKEVVRGLAAIMESDNDRFDRKKFYQSCGMKEEST